MRVLKSARGTVYSRYLHEGAAGSNICHRACYFAAFQNDIGYHISFTLLVPDPHFYMAGWNIEEAVEGVFAFQISLHYEGMSAILHVSFMTFPHLGVLRPFIQQLEAVRFASFSVESQVGRGMGGGGRGRGRGEGKGEGDGEGEGDGGHCTICKE